MNRWKLLIVACIVAVPLSALAQPDGESNVRRSMWKVWRSTVTAPQEPQADDADQPTRKQDPQPDAEVPSTASDTAADSSRDSSKTRPASALPRIELNRERLIPVQLPLIGQEQFEPAETDSAGQTTSPQDPGKGDSQAPRPEDSETPENPANPSQPAGPPPVRLAKTESETSDPQKTQDADSPRRIIGDPLLDDSPEHEVPPALVAALKMAQVSSADQVRDPAGLADRLYRRKLYRPAEFFYRTALVRQTDVDRPWVLLQLGNCLQHRDYAAAGETYSTILAEFPKSPWARLARVQQEICQFRLRNQADETIQDALKSVNQPEDPLAQELETSPQEVRRP